MNIAQCQPDLTALGGSYLCATRRYKESKMSSAYTDGNIFAQRTHLAIFAKRAGVTRRFVDFINLVVDIPEARLRFMFHVWPSMSPHP